MLNFAVVTQTGPRMDAAYEICCDQVNDGSGRNSGVLTFR